MYEPHETKPPSGDQGLTFQTHALQMMLFRPFLRANPTLVWVVTNCVLTICYDSIVPHELSISLTCVYKLLDILSLQAAGFQG